MNLESLKKEYGEEYPAAVTREGIRLPLHRESRFLRHFRSEEAKRSYIISRFTDRSASITASEVQREWASWTKELKMDFCNSCRGLTQQADFPEILRFIMGHGAPIHWCAIALSVAYHLPREEAFDVLDRALRSIELGRSSNIVQAIAFTGHPAVEAALREHLKTVWADPALWTDDAFLNPLAHAATSCIAHLIELGASPNDFEEQVRKLSIHACLHNRKACHSRLAKYYPWLKESEEL